MTVESFRPSKPDAGTRIDPFHAVGARELLGGNHPETGRISEHNARHVNDGTLPAVHFNHHRESEAVRHMHSTEHKLGLDPQAVKLDKGGHTVGAFDKATGTREHDLKGTYSYKDEHGKTQTTKFESTYKEGAKGVSDGKTTFDKPVNWHGINGVTKIEDNGKGQLKVSHDGIETVLNGKKIEEKKPVTGAVKVDAAVRTGAEIPAPRVLDDKGKVAKVEPVAPVVEPVVARTDAGQTVVAANADGEAAALPAAAKPLPKALETRTAALPAEQPKETVEIVDGKTIKTNGNHKYVIEEDKEHGTTDTKHYFKQDGKDVLMSDKLETPNGVTETKYRDGKVAYTTETVYGKDGEPSRTTSTDFNGDGKPTRKEITADGKQEYLYAKTAGGWEEITHDQQGNQVVRKQEYDRQTTVTYDKNTDRANHIVVDQVVGGSPLGPNGQPNETGRKPISDTTIDNGVTTEKRYGTDGKSYMVLKDGVPQNSVRYSEEGKRETTYATPDGKPGREVITSPSGSVTTNDYTYTQGRNGPIVDKKTSVDGKFTQATSEGPNSTGGQDTVRINADGTMHAESTDSRGNVWHGIDITKNAAGNYEMTTIEGGKKSAPVESKDPPTLTDQMKQFYHIPKI